LGLWSLLRAHKNVSDLTFHLRRDPSLIDELARLMRRAEMHISVAASLWSKVSRKLELVHLGLNMNVGC
jgi:hypothetical protein